MEISNKVVLSRDWQRKQHLKDSPTTFRGPGNHCYVWPIALLRDAGLPPFRICDEQIAILLGPRPRPRDADIAE